MINSKVSFTYDNTTVTKYATFGVIESFKKLIDFQKLLADCVQIAKHHNAKYQSVFLLELLIDAVILGITRFLHLDDLQNEPGFKKLKIREVFYNELAEVLNLSVETVWRYTRQKKDSCYRIGRKAIQVQKEAVLAVLAGGDGLVKEERPIYSKQGEYT